jgi:glycosyltransferase involved in cell wall biosynthesis
MKIAILISALRCGGAERVASLIANYWGAHDWPVTMLTLSSPDDAPFYELHKNVRYVSLDLLRPSANVFEAAKNNISRVLQVRAALKKDRPDVLISFIDSTNVCAVIAGRSLGIPVLVSEVAVPSLQNPGRAWNVLRRVLYPRSAGLIVPSHGVCDYCAERFKVHPIVIPNPVSPVAPLPRKSSNPGRRLVAMGRLSREKGFDMLLRAFALVRKDHPDATLEIMGEGHLRGELEALRGELGMNHCVEMPGAQKSPVEHLRRADLFVLSSRYEGFGNVLCEALAAGVPVVSFNCPTGPAEIVRDGVDGILVPPNDIAALAASISKLLSDGDRRRALSQRAPEIVDRFGIDHVMRIWQNVLSSIREEPSLSTSR